MKEVAGGGEVAWRLLLWREEEGGLGISWWLTDVSGEGRARGRGGMWVKLGVRGSGEWWE